ncbi:hypothetical protein NE237_011232 [Protea cynaroides]|uniref:Dof-type domain-containing protein n=1 Tax=Protea cynaroides TaxID=273540 RepID=A0A9Q0GVP0_9MAGN|nr:hypothetical protein NE237_011232 [Protea cynaroides]
MDRKEQKLLNIHYVSSTDSAEFFRLEWALNRSSVVGLDAEWKPNRSQQSSYSSVLLLQIACRIVCSPSDGDGDEQMEDNDSLVFLLDLMALPLPSIWELLRDMFVSPDILKLGFKFKQDLIYLSYTFHSQGCAPGFDRIEPFLDITSIYDDLQRKQPGWKPSKQTKSLSTICKEVLGISLSKELQCSDWSQRPLTEEQKIYAAADAYCLLEIFSVFLVGIDKEGQSLHNTTSLHPQNARLGLKQIFEKPDVSDYVFRRKFGEASDMVSSVVNFEIHQRNHSMVGSSSNPSHRKTIPLDESLSKIVLKYAQKILLKDSDRKPRKSKKKGRIPSSVGLSCRERKDDNTSDWQGPPPWDLSMGGDGCPKFLCDVMVEGLAKHLRCVGIDAAVPWLKKPEPRQLIDQAQKEKRVLLTRDAKMLRHEYLIRDQVYRVKTLLKNDQLLEVIETFQLKVSEDQLMSRCTKCNGRFIQKPLTTEEAIAAAKGFQVIPNCLFNKNIEFWQCTDCNQLYWEGTQYHNAVQKFIDVCKLNDSLRSLKTHRALLLPSMDTAQWQQEIGPMEEMVSNTCSRPMVERRARPQKEQALNCPRCNSTNTKFCYYNNYSLTQPRYFCKTCRRYWTEGGSLRNVPVGGGSRKNKRSSTSSSSSSSKKVPDLTPTSSSQNPKIHKGQDLNLAFPATHDFSTVSEFVELPNIENNNNNSSSNRNSNNPCSSSSSSFSALGLLRSGVTSSRGLNSFMPMANSDSNTGYPSGYGHLQDFKPTLNFSLDGLGVGAGGHGSLHGVHQENSGRHLFPFEDLRQVSSTIEFEQNRGQGDSTHGYWNGMLGGGSW